MATSDLIDFMTLATQQMGADYERIRKRATEDPGTAGDEGEENWAALLRNWLPATFHIVTKGRIIDWKGDASPQVDIIILQPEYPPHLVRINTKLYLAEGVLAAFECKLTLKAEHIHAFFTTCVKIKGLTSNGGGSPYKELQAPILFGLLAHSHIWNKPASEPINLIEEKLWKASMSLLNHPRQMPDLICIANLSCWQANKTSLVSPKVVRDWSTHAQTLYGSLGKATTTYYRNYTNNEQPFTPIGWMIRSLVTKLAWRITPLRSIAWHFNMVFQPIQQGRLRVWPLDIYSEEVRLKLEKGEVYKDDQGRTPVRTWEEWCVELW
jgi:hypothetical protein